MEKIVRQRRPSKSSIILMEAWNLRDESSHVLVEEMLLKPYKLM